MATIQPHPEEVRASVRGRTFNNPWQAEEAVRDVDNAVFERARNHEGSIVRQAGELMEKGTTRLNSADEVVSVMEAEVCAPLLADAAPSPALAAKYKAIRTRAEAEIQHLERMLADVEFLVPKLNDPYADLSRLWEVYPLVRPTLPH